MNRLASFVLAIVAAGFLSVGCPRAPDPVPPVPSSETAVVRRGTLEERLILTGELRAVKSRGLPVPQTPEWSVKIQWLRGDGSRVVAGDPVVQMDNSPVLAKLEDQRLALAEAEEQLQKARSDAELDHAKKSLELLRSRKERDKARLEASVPESVRSRREYQEKQLALEKAEAAFEKAREDLESFDRVGEIPVRLATLKRDMARRAVEGAEAVLDRLTLKAPADGVLIIGLNHQFDRRWLEGDSAWPGQVVAEIADITEMEVETWLSDVDDGRVLPGMPVRCRLDTDLGRVFRGRIARVGSVASGREAVSGRRFFPIRVALDRTDPELMRPGMSVEVEVVREHREGALLAPITSLDLGGRDPFLVLRGGGRRKVALAGCGPLDCALSEGPPAGTLLGEAR